MLPIEWWASLGLGAEEFLGTQGDPWDTQSDICMALIGVILANFTLARYQNHQIRTLDVTPIKGN